MSNTLDEVDAAAVLGTLAGRFQLQRKLGEGGMAVVYEARDVEYGRSVALKRLSVATAGSKRGKLVALFEREFFTLSQLAHPRVVEVYDYGVDEEGPFYTMELLDGGDLSALAPLDYRRACALARDVCSVLALLHSRRLVYRDLSPRNVRCTGDGAAKLIDFGAMVPMFTASIRSRAAIRATLSAWRSTS